MKIFIRVVSTLLVLGSLAGAAAWVYKSTRVQAKAELPSATARKGEFQVIVRCRGELTALRSVQLIAPVNVPGLQIAWQAPANSEVKAGDLVVKFDSSSSQQQLLENPALYMHLVALDADRWEVMRYSLWKDEASANEPNGDCVQTYGVLHVSEPA